MTTIVVILTFNSASVIARTVAAAREVSPDVLVVDSFSTDDTAQLARRLGCTLVQRAFTNYAEQRNWAIDQVAARHDWQLHLDADEVLDATLISEIKKALAEPGGCAGFVLARRTYFLGEPLRFGGTRNWHLRLFRSGSTRCEDRLYDQHFLCSGRSRMLRGTLHDLNVGSLSEWVNRHNRWSTLEAAELVREPAPGDCQVPARISSDPRERRRLYKGLYYHAPLLLRPILLFGWRYFVQLGFLDGRAGFLYAFLQAGWFRMMVDAKLLELQQARADAPAVSGALQREP